MSTHNDRNGKPIDVGTVCVFYGAIENKRTLRIKVVSLHEGYGLVDGEVLEIFERPDLWASEKVVSPPTRLLEVEEAAS